MKILIICSGKPSNPKWKFEIDQSFIYEQVESIKNLNVGVEYDTYFIEGKGILGYLKNYRSILKKLKLYQPDVIHAHYGLSGLLASIQRKVPVITTFHGSDINETSIRLFSYLASKLSRENIFVHPNMPKKINYKKEQHIIPCGVDIETFTPIDKELAREKLGLEINKKYALFTSSFNNSVKNYPLAKEAIDRCNMDIELLELKGYNRKEVSWLMSAVDVLIITSFSETGPIVVKEAMCCNCPIVSVEVGDVRDVISNTEGCYITGYDSNELTQSIDNVLELNQRTTGNTKVKEYALKTVARQVFKIYKSNTKTKGDK